jgi:hypothetical protein
MTELQIVSACNRQSLLGDCGKATPHPFFEASLKRRYFPVSSIEQNARQTGACGFIGSGAIENDFFFLG